MATTTPSTGELLKFQDQQMAAEAFVDEVVRISAGSLSAVGRQSETDRTGEYEA